MTRRATIVWVRALLTAVLAFHTAALASLRAMPLETKHQRQTADDRTSAARMAEGDRQRLHGVELVTVTVNATSDNDSIEREATEFLASRGIQIARAGQPPPTDMATVANVDIDVKTISDRTGGAIYVQVHVRRFVQFLGTSGVAIVPVWDGTGRLALFGGIPLERIRHDLLRNELSELVASLTPSRQS